MTEQEFLEKHKSERQPCEIYSRVMGYIRRTADFNIGKVGEFNERKFFKEPHRNKEE